MADEHTYYLDRDDKGRFVPGHAGGPGRPAKAVERAYLDELKQKFPPDVLAAKLARALELAEQQNSPRAMATVAELILSYTLGKPRQSLSVSSGDGTALLAAILSDRTPLLPPRQGIIVDTPQITDGEDE